MAQSDIQVTAGSGTRLRTATKSISGQTRHEEYGHLGEPDEATYTASAASVSWATANDHTFQLMAGSSLNVYVRRIQVWQAGLATTAIIVTGTILRLTTAGTGGTARTPAPLDTTDGASGATVMTLPTAKGTEGVTLYNETVYCLQTVPTSAYFETCIFDVDYERLRGKALRIPAGTANGIALKNLTAVAGMSVTFTVTFSEASY